MLACFFLRVVSFAKDKLVCSLDASLELSVKSHEDQQGRAVGAGGTTQLWLFG